MAKASFVFLMVALLFCSDIPIGTCQHIDQLSPVEEFSQYANQSNNQGVFCPVCKVVVRKVMATLGKHISKNAVGRKLDNICVKIKIQYCKRFVRKYRAKLINALSTGGRHAICAKLKVCRRIYM